MLFFFFLANAISSALYLCWSEECYRLGAAVLWGVGTVTQWTDWLRGHSVSWRASLTPRLGLSVRNRKEARWHNRPQPPELPSSSLFLFLPTLWPLTSRLHIVCSLGVSHRTWSSFFTVTHPVIWYGVGTVARPLSHPSQCYLANGRSLDCLTDTLFMNGQARFEHRTSDWSCSFFVFF